MSEEIKPSILEIYDLPDYLPETIPVRQAPPFRRAYTEDIPVVFERAALRFTKEFQSDLEKMGRSRDSYYVIGVAIGYHRRNIAFATDLDSQGVPTGIFEEAVETLLGYKSLESEQ